jgi:hypothetical protein
MQAFYLLGTATYLVIALCWAGILPVWLLAPEPVQPALETALHTLLWPVLALVGAVSLVTLLRLGGALCGGWPDRLAGLGLQVAGLVFACMALRAVVGLSFAGYGSFWPFVDIALHVGGGLALLVLPFVTVIVAVAGLVNVLQRAWRDA